MGDLGPLPHFGSRFTSERPIGPNHLLDIRCVVHTPVDCRSDDNDPPDQDRT